MTNVWLLTSNVCSNQARQMLRTHNVARSIYEISAHASMYMPLAIPSSRLPSYVQMDRSSFWQTSALLSTALESMTLPSRLRPGGGKRGRLDDMEAALNVNGSQRIANVQMSITDPLVPKHKQPPSGKARDGRMRGSNADGQVNEDQLVVSDASLDMDFFCGEAEATSTNAFRAQKQKRNQVFGHVESVRGDLRNSGDREGGQDEEDEEVGYARKRRRLAGLPPNEKSVRVSGPWLMPASMTGCAILEQCMSDSSCTSCLHLTNDASNQISLPPPISAA